MLPIAFLKISMSKSQNHTQYRDLRGLPVLPDKGIVTINNLDNFIEGLYDGLDGKVWAANAILLLVRQPAYTHQLAHNELLMSAICRVLREDGENSNELSICILDTLYCLSNSVEYAHILFGNKVVDLCFRLIDMNSRKPQSKLAKVLVNTDSEKLECSTFH